MRRLLLPHLVSDVAVLLDLRQRERLLLRALLETGGDAQRSEVGEGRVGRGGGRLVGG